MKTKKICSLIFIFVMLAIILACIFSNVTKTFGIFIKDVKQLGDSQDIQGTINSIETDIKSDLVFKPQAVDINGMVLNVLNKKIVGNDEFFKDKEGKSNICNNNFSSEPFAQSMIELKGVAMQKNIPIVYMRLPDRITDKTDQVASGYCYWIQQQDNINRTLKEYNIDSIDLNEILTEQELANYYFKTDVHATTHSEFITANYLTDYLSNEYGLHFYNSENVFDIHNYTINSYPFLGNTSRNTGRFYSGMDNFQIFHPLFETNLHLSVNNEKESIGTYDEVCLNGMENGEYDEFTYWVVNYMQYPNPYYSISNKAATSAPSILVITDSILMRCNSFLSLTCANISMIDPRTDDGFSVMRAIKEHDFDAIVVSASDQTLLENYFNSQSHEEFEYGSEFLDYSYDGNSVVVCVKNTSYFNWTQANQIRCQLLINGQDRGIRAILPEKTVVKPGESIVFKFDNINEWYNIATTIDVQMLQETQRYFNEKYRIKGE